MIFFPLKINNRLSKPPYIKRSVSTIHQPSWLLGRRFSRPALQPLPPGVRCVDLSDATSAPPTWGDAEQAERERASPTGRHTWERAGRTGGFNAQPARCVQARNSFSSLIHLQQTAAGDTLQDFQTNPTEVRPNIKQRRHLKSDKKLSNASLLSNAGMMQVITGRSQVRTHPVF